MLMCFLYTIHMIFPNALWTWLSGSCSHLGWGLLSQFPCSIIFPPVCLIHQNIGYLSHSSDRSCHSFAALTQYMEVIYRIKGVICEWTKLEIYTSEKLVSGSLATPTSCWFYSSSNHVTNVLSTSSCQFSVSAINQHALTKLDKGLPYPINGFT